MEYTVQKYGLQDFSLHEPRINVARVPIRYHEIQITSVPLIHFVPVKGSMKSGHPRASLKTAARV